MNLSIESKCCYLLIISFLLITGCIPKHVVKNKIPRTEYESMGIAAFKAQNYEEAVTLLNQAGDSPAVNAYIGMSYLRMKNKTEAAFPYLKIARNSLDSIDNIELKAMILFGWAVYHDNKANFDESYFSYLDAQQLFWKSQDKESFAKVCNNIAVLLGKLSWYEKAQQWFERAADAASPADKQRYRRLSFQTAQLSKEQYKPSIGLICLDSSFDSDVVRNIEEELTATGRFSLVDQKKLKERLNELLPLPYNFEAVDWDSVGRTGNIDVALVLKNDNDKNVYHLYSIKYQKEYDTGIAEFDQIQKWVNRLCVTYGTLTYQLE